MKNLLSALSSTLQGGVRGGLLILTLLATTTLWAYDFKSGELCYNITSSSAPYTVEVTYKDKVNNYPTTIATIPQTVIYNRTTTYSVTSIGASAFYHSSSLKSVTIPNSVTSIGDYAFHSCSSLTSVTIPNSVTSIGDGAFAYCSSLTSVTIPNSVTSIGDGAFAGCSSLTSVIIPNSVTSIGENAFAGCSSLTSVTIPNSVTSIGDQAFRGCSSLTSVTIPNSVTSIGDGVCYGCSSLTSPVYNAHCFAYLPISFSGAYTIPDGIEQIAGSAFYGCTQFTSITIPNSVTSIGDQAFRGCSSLKSVTIPNSVTSIGSGAFADCSSLTSVTIPNSVMSIRDHTFYECSSLTSLTIPNSVTNIGDYAFYRCSSLTTVICGAATPPVLENNYVFGESSLTAVYIPDNTLSTYQTAWGADYIYVNNETTLTINVNIPGTLSSEISKAGKSPTQVAKLIVAGTLRDTDFTYMRETMTSLTDVDLSAITNSEGVNFKNNLKLTNIILPNNLIVLGDSAFKNCSFLKSVTIGNSVTSIGDYALTHCSSLKSVIIGNSVTSIGDYALSHCSSLKSVTIGNSVTSIGDYAFSYCRSLTSITIPNSVTSIGDQAFFYCESLESVTIPNSVTSIRHYAFYSTGLYNNTSNWENGVLYISNCLIEAKSISGAYTIKANTRLVAEDAFQGASSLTSITIPNSVTNIGDHAFWTCSSLTKTNFTGDIAEWCNITFGDYLANPIYRSKNLYINNKLVKDLVIPNTVDSISDYAFYNCDSITSITCYAETPVKIGNSTFSSISTSIPVYIPCNSEFAYSKANGWSRFSNYQDIPSKYVVEVSSQNSQIGTAEVDKHTSCETIISATPSYGYHFTQWSDGNTDNPRSLFLTKDTELTATFAKNTYNVNVSYNEKEGNVAGNTSAKYLESATITATPNFGYHFTQWSDGNTDNPRTIVLTQDTTLTAEFGMSLSGQCGDNLSWEYNENTKTLTINGFGDMYNFTSSTQPWLLFREQITTVITPAAMQHIGNYAFYNCFALTEINIPNSVKTIGGYAFSSCYSLTSIAIGNSVNTIGSYAFYDCSGLASITIPESVTRIGDGAFHTCTALTAITCESTTPPAIGNSTFRNVPQSVPVYVPCGSESAYKTADGWSNLKYIQEPQAAYVVSVSSQNSQMGSAKVDKNTSCETTISATPNIGHHFVQWSDGNTDNPRSLVLMQDTTLTAEFAINTYTLTIKSNLQGNIIGNGTYNHGETVILSATADIGYHFVRWSDGNIDNPRTIVLTQDTVLTAEFAQSFSGQCGENLYWAYNESEQSLSISGTGDMYNYTTTTQPWILFKEKIKTVYTTNTVTSFGTSAFEGAIRLAEVYIGSAFATIEDRVFAGCTRLRNIHCYPTYPPIIFTSSFERYDANLYIPCDYLEDYTFDPIWNKFTNIQCSGAEKEEVENNGVEVDPSSTSVTMIWPTEEDANTYTIEIRKDGAIFCRLTFNTEGQLLNLSFAPARNGKKHAVQYATKTANGLRFTVTGLNESTHYTYNLKAKDKAEKALQSYSGEFTTKSSNISSGVENTDTQHVTSDTRKIICDNQLIILRDGVEYNAMGVRL